MAIKGTVCWTAALGVDACGLDPVGTAAGVDTGTEGGVPGDEDGAGAALGLVLGAGGVFGVLATGAGEFDVGGGGFDVGVGEMGVAGGGEDTGGGRKLTGISPTGFVWPLGHGKVEIENPGVVPGRVRLAEVHNEGEGVPIDTLEGRTPVEVSFAMMKTLKFRTAEAQVGHCTSMMKLFEEMPSGRPMVLP